MVTRTKKIFVGGLSASTVQADLTSYFSTFGKVEEAMLMFDRQAKGIELFCNTYARKFKVSSN